MHNTCMCDQICQFKFFESLSHWRKKARWYRRRNRRFQKSGFPSSAVSPSAHHRCRQTALSPKCSYAWVRVCVEVRKFSRQVCFYKSQLMRRNWRTPLSGPVLCVRNGYNGPQLPREISSTSLRPDIVTWSIGIKTALLIELTVPWEE